MAEPLEIIVISLRESTQRRARAAAQLNAAGVAWRFQDAIKGAELPALPPEYHRARRLQLEGFDLNPAEIGCFLSHRQAWQACFKSQRPMLILEDDFRLKQNLTEVLAEVCDCLPHFDVLRLQGIDTTYKYHVLKKFTRDQLVRHHRDPLGTTAYVLQPAAAKRLLKKSVRFHEAVDDFMGGYWRHRLKILSIFPFPIGSDGSPSTVQNFGKPSLPLNSLKKLLTKLHKLPVSAARRLHWLGLRLALCRRWPE